MLYREENASYRGETIMARGYSAPNSLTSGFLTEIQGPRVFRCTTTTWDLKQTFAPLQLSVCRSRQQNGDPIELTFG